MRSIPRASSYTAMADGSPPPPVPVPVPVAGRETTLEDLDFDALGRCASFLPPPDVASVAMVSKSLCAAAYSDNVWSQLNWRHWPYICAFDDPLECYFIGYSPSHIMLDRNNIFVAQGSIVQRFTLDRPGALPVACETLRYHESRITCMRLFPIINTSLFQNEAQNDENVLVTSSSDKTISAWWKDRPHRCFKGHNGPVTALSDKLLGDGWSKVFASAAEDCTIRLWSLTSSGKKHPLRLTYHGHEEPLSFLSVASYKASLLVSVCRERIDNNVDVSKASGHS